MQFKLQPCTVQSCALRTLNNAMVPHSKYFDCFFHHGDFDLRRSTDYKPIYLVDSNDPSNPFCNNIFEFLYHQEVHQTIPCPYTSCQFQHCPYNHKLKTSKPQKEQKFMALLATNVEQMLLQNPSKLKLNRDQSQASDHSFTIQSPTESQRYYYDQQVQFFEDATHEFKMFKQIKLELVSRYICAYLNARGGTLFVGITDQGRVRGIRITREEIDDFQLELDHILRKFDPCVLQEQIVLSFNPVFTDQNFTQSLQNQFVIEFKVLAVNQYELYFTHQREAYVKRAASINMLQPKEIKAYVRQRTVSQLQTPQIIKKK